MKPKTIEKYKGTYCLNCVYFDRCKEQGLTDDLIKLCRGGYKWKTKQ